ncbi:MAG: glycosyltransferase, partial [Bacteroidota bacterium]
SEKQMVSPTPNASSVICHPPSAIHDPAMPWLDLRSASTSGIRHLVILPFIDRMDLAYAAADLIISRAGAIAISELCVVGKPAILIPSPNVAEDHQTKNAMALVGQKAALMIRDQEAVVKLGAMIGDVLGDQDLQTSLKNNMKPLAISDAAEKIAVEALKLIHPSASGLPASAIQGPASLHHTQPA